MNDQPANENHPFEDELGELMRAAVATIEPDTESALKATRAAAGRTGRTSNLHRSQQFLAVAAALAIFGGAIFAVTRFASDSDQIQVGDENPAPATTAAPETTVPAAEESAAAIEITTLMASEIPALTDPLTGGDAVRVDWVLTTTSSGQEPFRYTEIWADDGRVYGLSVDGESFERREGDTLVARRDTLGMDASPAEWQDAILTVGGFRDPVAAGEGARADRLWDDAWDLLASATLDDDQRAYLFAAIEEQLGAEFASVPTSVGFDILEIRWDGHSDGEARTLSTDMASGAPLQFRQGEAIGGAGIRYAAARIALADLDLDTPPGEVEPGVVAPGVLLDANGFVAVDPSSGDAVSVPFGTPGPEVVDLITGAFGEPSTTTEAMQCGRGSTDAVGWGAFSISIDAGTGLVVGWSVNQANPILTTSNGLGLGSTVGEVLAVYPDLVMEETTLGWELTGGPISWLPTGPTDTDTIAAMWAGETCVFR